MVGRYASTGSTGRRSVPDPGTYRPYSASRRPAAKPVSLVLVHRCGSHAGLALESASGPDRSNISVWHAYVALSLLVGIRTEEA
ncbi:MAG: hypothetical protein ACRDOE_01800, partial [Streptosporangiaceae bacterium]